MIRKKSIPNGVMLRVKPFNEPNRNAACEILARVVSSQGTRRDAHICVCNLNNLMTLSDTTILMTAMRSLLEETQKYMDEVQEKAAKTKTKKKRKAD